LRTNSSFSSPLRRHRPEHFLGLGEAAHEDLEHAGAGDVGVHPVDEQRLRHTWRAEHEDVHAADEGDGEGSGLLAPFHELGVEGVLEQVELVLTKERVAAVMGRAPSVRCPVG
jgi:hypothetical protein